IDRRRAEVLTCHSSVKSPGGRIRAVIGVIESLTEVIHAGKQLVYESRSPGTVPDQGEVVLAAGHNLEVFLENRVDELRRFTRAEKRSSRNRLIVASAVGEFDQTIVAFAGVVVA